MYIVTGGAGFIGSNIVKGLNKRGIKNILVVDNLSNPSKHLNLNSLDFEDYIDKNDFLNIHNKIDKIEAIFHNGACSSTTETNGLYMMKNNYEYSKILLNFALEKNSPFIYASSASVYGNGENGFKEDSKYEYPLNIYAYSKFLFDNYIRKKLNQKSNTQIVGLRYFNVYGPQENHKGLMASQIFNLYNQIKSRNIMRIFEGSKDFLRDFIHVDDVVDINMFFLNKKISGIFNCGTGTSKSFYEIAKILKSLNNGNGRIKFIKFPKYLIGKYQKFTKADLKNLRNVGFDNKFKSLENGISDYFKILSKTNGYYI